LKEWSEPGPTETHSRRHFCAGPPQSAPGRAATRCAAAAMPMPCHAMPCNAMPCYAAIPPYHHTAVPPCPRAPVPCYAAIPQCRHAPARPCHAMPPCRHAWRHNAMPLRRSAAGRIVAARWAPARPRRAPGLARQRRGTGRRLGRRRGRSAGRASTSAGALGASAERGAPLEGRAGRRNGRAQALLGPTAPSQRRAPAIDAVRSACTVFPEAHLPPRVARRPAPALRGPLDSNVRAASNNLAARTPSDRAALRPEAHRTPPRHHPGPACLACLGCHAPRICIAPRPSVVAPCFFFL
jgi:hypothetical protein